MERVPPRRCVPFVAHMWRSGDSLREVNQFPSSTMWALRSKHRSLGLVTSTFTYWPCSPMKFNQQQLILCQESPRFGAGRGRR